MEAASASRPSLGEYFAERGLITQADLERAQAEHLATNRRLADILVKRGLVTGADITRALMDQLGMSPPTPTPAPPETPVATETPAEEPEEPRTQPELTLVPPADDPWPGQTSEHTPEQWPGETSEHTPEPWPGEVDFDSWPGQTPLDQPVATLSALPDTTAPVETEPPGGAQAEPFEPAPFDLSSSPADDEPAAEAVPEPMPAAEPPPEPPQEAPLAAALDPAAAALEATPDVHAMIAAKQFEQSEVLATAVKLAARASELQAEIDELVEQAAAAGAARAVEHEPPQPAPAVPEKPGGVFLVPRHDRFELVELDVEPPPVGGNVDLGDRRYVVTKIASSPLPFDRRSCAVLAEASETA